MFVPRPLRQSLVVEKRLIGPRDDLVESRERHRIGTGRDRSAVRLLVARRRAGERSVGIVERREVQRRSERLRLGRLERIPRVVRRRKNAVIDLTVGLRDLRRNVVAKLLELGGVSLHRLREIAELEREQVGVGHPHHG